jgi:hypothetical protein
LRSVFQTEVGQLPGLANRAWLIREGIAAGIVVDQILTHERIPRQRGGGIEYVDPTRAMLKDRTICF